MEVGKLVFTADPGGLPSEEFYYKLRHSIDMKRKCKILKEDIEIIYEY